MADPAQILNQIAPHNLLASFFQGGQTAPMSQQELLNSTVSSGTASRRLIDQEVQRMIGLGATMQLLDPGSAATPEIRMMRMINPGREGSKKMAHITWIISGIPGSKDVQVSRFSTTWESPAFTPPPEMATAAEVSPPSGRGRRGRRIERFRR